MASSQIPKGRGRGRSAAASSTAPTPSITSNIDASRTPASATIDTSASFPTAINEPSTSTISTTSRPNTFSTSHSSASNTAQLLDPSPSVEGGGGARGPGLSRGSQLEQDTVLTDPYWIVTNLTDAQFNSNERPTKPDEIGELGEKIQVIANYFPLLQFPYRGLVYKYNIKINNKKNLEIHRDRLR